MSWVATIELSSSSVPGVKPYLPQIAGIIRRAESAAFFARAADWPGFLPKTNRSFAWNFNEVSTSPTNWYTPIAYHGYSYGVGPLGGATRNLMGRWRLNTPSARVRPELKGLASRLHLGEFCRQGDLLGMFERGTQSGRATKQPASTEAADLQRQ